MYIYQLRQKSSGLFYNGTGEGGEPLFAERGILFHHYWGATPAKCAIAKYRKSQAYSLFKEGVGPYTNFKVKLNRLLRPGNYEVVTYFCTLHSVN